MTTASDSLEVLNLQGKVIISGVIHAVTGLHVGGSRAGLEIGGLDNPVVRDPMTKYPYIPGSSLKGKMRSLLTKALGKELRVVRAATGKTPPIRIHVCENPECELCNTFGRPAEKGVTPTRLIVRDAMPTEETQGILAGLDTELLYTELKWENQIDRITSAANPRQTERVPAGSEFDFEMVLSVYNGGDDIENLRHLFEAMKLLEDDYIGGQGTRGYGKALFKDINLFAKSKAYYKGKADSVSVFSSPSEEEMPREKTEMEFVISTFEEIKKKILETFQAGKGA